MNFSFVERRISISSEAEPLPFPYAFEQPTIDNLFPSVKQTPLREAIQQTVEHFHHLQDVGLFHSNDLPKY